MAATLAVRKTCLDVRAQATAHGEDHCHVWSTLQLRSVGVGFMVPITFDVYTELQVRRRLPKLAACWLAATAAKQGTTVQFGLPCLTNKSNSCTSCYGPSVLAYPEQCRP
jgi:hypothetical protein